MADWRLYKKKVPTSNKVKQTNTQCLAIGAVFKI